MTTFTQYDPGTFNWVDLATSDTQGALSFYTELFGWSSFEMPAGDGMAYTMLQKEGKNVAGLYQVQEGKPTYWSSYVSVTDVEAMAQKATELGGNILMKPDDVMSAGRMALIQDPTGAMFVLWQPKEHFGADIANEPGSFCWNELMTPNAEQASQFYTALFGWEAKVQEMADGTPYTVLMNGERMNGGLMQIREEWGEIPPHWLVYFAVAECDGSAAQAESLGAKILMPATDIPQVGRFSLLQDPQGGLFAIIQMA